MAAVSPPDDEDLTGQDREFLAAMQGEVAPASTAASSLEAAAAVEADRERDEFLRYLADHPPRARASGAVPSPASTPSVAARDLRRLAADPNWAPDGQIDLHGRTRLAAVEALERFVQWAEGEGLVHILVIVGQGHHSPGGETVVADAVCRWLAGRGLVYTEAPRRLGGGGALLVALSQREGRC